MSGIGDKRIHPQLNQVAMKSYENIMGLSAEKTLERNEVIVCGSMTFYEKMVEVKRFLQSENISCIIPEDESSFCELINDNDATLFKRRASNSYLRRIRKKSTVAILVYNETKRNVKNYIGPNTLVEIAMAFMWNRGIFLFDGIYEPLCDELEAWKCISLNRDFSKLLAFMKEKNTNVGQEDENLQLTLFDI